ncbi:MAG TPA: phytanoyl-CoA dioxygenase family protein [Rhizomicrobium sp.]|nr:phytanoyl-CoA dioxygenase family protein [Rhizomicrobium sp.]
MSPHSLTTDERAQWERDGFFIRRGSVSPDDCDAVVDELIGVIRAAPPSAHPGEAFYGAGDYRITTETVPTSAARRAEDDVSKVFNAHALGKTRAAGESAALAEPVCDLLGPEIDCFQSQFILKNPGVIGQPWHQDSFYFYFDKQPQVAAWVALSRATLANGCLWVLPGSHKETIHKHIPDRRPAANKGYLEIIDADFSGRVAVTLEKGDVLFFHSFLMHMSTDNRAEERRATMVYHYGRAGTKIKSDLPAALAASLNAVNRWVPVRRV